jgi:hypothetical protein
MKDWRGTEIEVGDTIVYVVKESTNTPMHEAIVTGIGEAPKYPWLDDEMIPVAHATWARASMYGEHRVNRKVCLKHPENITVIAKGRAATRYKRLLRAYCEKVKADTPYAELTEAYRELINLYLEESNE